MDQTSLLLWNFVASHNCTYYRHFDDGGGEICVSLHRMRLLSRTSFEATTNAGLRESKEEKPVYY